MWSTFSEKAVQMNITNRIHASKWSKALFSKTAFLLYKPRVTNIFSHLVALSVRNNDLRTKQSNIINVGPRKNVEWMLVMNVIATVVSTSLFSRNIKNWTTGGYVNHIHRILFLWLRILFFSVLLALDHKNRVSLTWLCHSTHPILCFRFTNFAYACVFYVSYTLIYTLIYHLLLLSHHINPPSFYWIYL